MKSSRNIFGIVIMLVLLVMMPGSGSGFSASTSLLDAAKNGDTRTVQTLLDRGADINQQGEYGYTPLIWAVEKGHAETAILLINRGANVNIKTGSGYTALHAAGIQSRIIKLLLDKGADVNAVWVGWKTPLSSAVEAKRSDIIKLLLSRNADVDLAISGMESYGATGNTSYFNARQWAQEHIEILLKAKEEYAQSAGKKQETVSTKTIRSDIDDIPAVRPKQKNNAYAIVIGIEEYRQKLPQADFAVSDAKLVSEYLTKAMGYPEENVVLLTNEKALQSDLTKYFEKWLHNQVEKDGTVFIYYSGHGAPDHKTGWSYLVPYDGDPSFISETGYSLKRMYDTLGKLPAKEIIVILDSCFSGAGGRSVIAKGVRPLVMNLPDNTALPKNMTILTASSGEQVSSTYDEKGHGLFTYFMLKGIKNEDVLKSDGSIEIVDLFSYIKPQVERIARKQFNNEQTPQLIGQKPIR